MGRAGPEGREGRRPLRRLRFADRHGPAHRHRRALTLCGPGRRRRGHDLGEGDDGPHAARDLPLRRDRQVAVLAGARRRHQGVAGTLPERPHGEVRALLVSLRVLACAVFAVLASAAPAQAQLETAPTVIPFEDGQTPPIRSGAGEVLGSDCGDRTVASGGWNGGTYLVLGCPFTFLSFSEPQAMVEFFVRMPAGETWVFRACAGQQCSIASQQVVGNGGVDAGGPGRPRRQRDDPAGRARDPVERRPARPRRRGVLAGAPARHGDLRVDPVRRRRAGDVRAVLQRRGAGGVRVLARRRGVRALLDPVHGDGARGWRAHAGGDVRRRLRCRRPHAGAGHVQRRGVRHRRRRPPGRVRQLPDRRQQRPGRRRRRRRRQRLRTTPGRQRRHRSRASTPSSARSPARCS